jgi:hypothetical protein
MGSIEAKSYPWFYQDSLFPEFHGSSLFRNDTYLPPFSSIFNINDVDGICSARDSVKECMGY